MSSFILIILFSLALLSGPAAFALLWLAYRRSGEIFLRSLAITLIGLTFTLLGNGATIVLDNILRLHDYRYGYLIMNGVFLASVISSAFLCRFVHEATGIRISFSRKFVFAVISVVFYVLNLALPIFLDGRGAMNVDYGYLASTLYCILCLAYASIVAIANPMKAPEPYRSIFPRAFILFLPLGLLAVLNDIFHFGILFHGPNIPFSPFFFLFINSGVIVMTLRVLAKGLAAPSATAETAINDIGLTERERELIPFIIDGLSNEEIGKRLFISPHTVKNHVTNIYRKTGVTNRIELLKLMTARSS